MKRYTCEEVFRRLDDYLDRELTPEELRLVEEHLDCCAQCALEHAFERDLLEDLKAKVRRLSAPSEVIERVQRRLEEARRGA